MIERYSFVSFDAYESVKHKFPHAVSCGDSKIIQYASPRDSAEMLEYNAQMIISAIENGIEKIYSCNHDVALQVVDHFKKEEVML